MAAQLSPQALDQVGMQGESVLGGWLTGERVFLRRLGTLTGVEGGGEAREGCGPVCSSLEDPVA